MWTCAVWVHRFVFWTTAEHVTPGPAFLVGDDAVLLRVPQMGSAWDVDRSSGRMVITVPVVAAGVRIFVMQHWLDQFRRTLLDKR